MKTKYFFLLIFLFILTAFNMSANAIPDRGVSGGTAKAEVKVVTINDSIITPVIAEYISSGIKKAEMDNAQCLIILLDTPGGLLKSAERIVKDIMNSKVPVVTYIYPQGARAASAGVFIGYASHILAMAPSTHIGAAHPVIGIGSWGRIDKVMKEKIMNDTLAWAETIANTRGRNALWIKDAVKKSVSIGRLDAKKLGVIDITARDLDDLLKKLDNKEIKLGGKRIILNRKNAKISYINLNRRQRFLNIIINPNAAYILLALGFLGILFEITHPGIALPGIAGIIAVLLAFYALQVLPVNYAGLALLILGILFFVIEAFTPTFGLFTLAAIVSLFFGSLMLFNQPEAVKVSLKIIISVISAFSFLSLFLLFKVIQSHYRLPMSGRYVLIGEKGIAGTDIEKRGKVFIHGEIWDAESRQLIKKGEEVKVEGIKGLKLIVKQGGAG